MQASTGRKVKIGLGALAVLGLGAALTSAQWVDQVFFQADVATGTFNIQGAVAPAGGGQPTGWVESNTWDGTQGSVASIQLDLGTVQIAPNEQKTVTGYVRNDPASTWIADVSDIDVAPFLPAGITASAAYTGPAGAAAALAPGASVPFQVTVTSNGSIAQGATGQLAVTIDGKSTVPSS